MTSFLAVGLSFEVACRYMRSANDFLWGLEAIHSVATYPQPRTMGRRVMRYSYFDLSRGRRVGSLEEKSSSRFSCAQELQSSAY